MGRKERKGRMVLYRRQAVKGAQSVLYRGQACRRIWGRGEAGVCFCFKILETWLI